MLHWPPHSQGLSVHSLVIVKSKPEELTRVILTTSLTKAIAFSGWNLQVPFCANTKESTLNPRSSPARPAFEYASAAMVRIPEPCKDTYPLLGALCYTGCTQKLGLAGP